MDTHPVAGEGAEPAGPDPPADKACGLGSVEIACDESGAEGENLVGGNTDVFAHASIRLGPEQAAACLLELRERIRSPAVEYKANHLLREKHRSVLIWLLGPDSPIHGKASVHLTDNTFLVVRRIVDTLIGDAADAESGGLFPSPETEASALALVHDGPRVLGAARWRTFLEASTALLRVRIRGNYTDPVGVFFELVGDVHAERHESIHEIVAGLRQARPRAEAFRSGILADPSAIPALDPLIPAIARAVIHWSAGVLPVSVVHDQQNSLTAARIDQLGNLLERTHASPGRVFAGLRLVDSRADSRVQLADILAGVARKISSDVLNRRADAELSGLLRPHVDPSSTWTEAFGSHDTAPLPIEGSGGSHT
ncbi:hypothetical protein [Phytoactinopolyspora alkaliphila]|uniref:hypothetical protein n=1 Tax=Phytoactinopolyspora alkaliphila TaxID=1783498 RepID=UPI001C201E71|nr:hypothetical protein [Phytoactinopolyspora alkaliphila]